MRRKGKMRFFALIVVATMVAAACGGGGTDPGDDEPTGEKGGVYRVETDAFEWTASLDPTGEYLGLSWGIFSNLMLRTLVTYRHVAGEAGNEIVPDLAEDLPEISEDGLTYTFTLKEGVKFGPPLNRDITSADVEYAFKRIGADSVAAQYGFYYEGVIEGLDAVKTVDDDISGIETPDDRTIEFTLTEPTGDFLFRLAMPATAPMPEEVAKCWTKAQEYGRYVISTGPYMIEGADELDVTSCDTMKPIAGFDPNQFLKLVRNPEYDPDTDEAEIRSANIDRFELTLNTNTGDIFDKLESGEIEGEVASPPPQVLRKYATDDGELAEHFHKFSGDRTWYLTMNLTQPPFDDIHVRKAANLVMDKDALRRVWGGPDRGDIATHIVPDVMLEDQLADYDPYASENFAGDVEKAKEEMKQSKYDTDGDGVCDAPVCKNVLHIARTTPPHVDMVPIVEDSMAEIGIELTTREVEDSYTVIQTTSRNVPFASNAGWGKDYADPSTFMVLFDSGSIIPSGNVNYSLVGVTPDQATEQKLGLKGVVEGVPSVDDMIKECKEIQDDDERLTCWADLDKHLMEEVVPWVPYLDATNIDITGAAVTHYEYDQFSGEAAFAHVSVDKSMQ